MVGIFVVRAARATTNALAPINRGIYIAQALAVVGAGAVAFVYVGNDKGTAPGTSP